VPIIAGASVDATTRDAWLERLFEAQRDDQIPYLEGLADHWGELCASKEVASAWADQLVGRTRTALRPDKLPRVHFHGTSACLSALYRAERFDELVDLLSVDVIWPYKQWAVRALAGSGKLAEALRYAEACRRPWASDHEIDAVCEDLLLSSGLVDEAYARYAMRANQRGTYLATFRAVAKKYPRKPASEILADLATTTPGDEGKWFAAAKDAGLYDEALALARRTPCDPKTLARAAHDFGESEPAFAIGAGLLSPLLAHRGLRLRPHGRRRAGRLPRDPGRVRASRPHRRGQRTHSPDGRLRAPRRLRREDPRPGTWAVTRALCAPR
jgi:hypothetical protein